MRTAILIGLFFLWIASGYAQGQTEKPDAAVGRVVLLGEIREGEIRFIHTSLQAELSRSYKLVSQDDYERAENLAFAELESEECTEDQCIRKIQEILQVERLFILQIIREQVFTQISLTLARGTDKIIRASRCRACDIGKLDDAVIGLVAEIREEDLAGPPGPPLAVAVATPGEPAQEPPIEESPVEQATDDSDPARMQWIVVGIGAGSFSFSNVDDIRGKEALARKEDISGGSTTQVYVDVFAVPNLAIGFHIVNVSPTVEEPSVEEFAIANTLITGTFIPTDPDAYLRYGVIAGFGSSQTTYRLKATKPVALKLQDEINGSAVLLGGYVDWGRDDFGARAGLYFLSTTYSEKLFDTVAVDGSGVALIIEMRWAFMK